MEYQDSLHLRILQVIGHEQLGRAQSRAGLKQWRRSGEKSEDENTAQGQDTRAYSSYGSIMSSNKTH